MRFAVAAGVGNRILDLLPLKFGMYKIHVLLLTVLILAVAMQAQSFTLDVTDESEFFLVNAGIEPITIHGYEIRARVDALKSENWNSIADQVVGPGGMDLMVDLGVQVAGFAEFVGDHARVGELNQAGVIWPVGYRLSIGLGCQPYADSDDLTFTYTTEIDGAWTTLEGAIIPEPATCTLLGLGVVGVLRRRKA